MTVTDLDAFRLELGDTDSSAPLFNDTEAQYWLDQRPGNVLLAVADACDSLARRYSRMVDVSTDGQSLKLSQRATSYKEAADALRKRAIASSAPWNGGGSRSRKQDLCEDPDRVQPAFRRGEFDNPSGS